MALPDLANAPISFTHKRNDKVLRGVRVRPDIRLGYFIVITSYGEYSENLATEPNLVRKSLDNNKPKVNASPHGMVYDLKLSAHMNSCRTKPCTPR